MLETSRHRGEAEHQQKTSENERGSGTMEKALYMKTLCNARPDWDFSASAVVSPSFRAFPRDGCLAGYWASFASRRDSTVLGHRQSNDGCRPDKAARRCCFLDAHPPQWYDSLDDGYTARSKGTPDSVGGLGCTSACLQCNLSLFPFVSQPCSGVPASQVPRRHKVSPTMKARRLAAAFRVGKPL